MSDPEFGYLLALLSAAAFAFANNCISRASTSGGDRGVLFSVLVTIAIAAAIWLLREGGRPATSLTAAGLGWFALAGLGAMVFGRSLLYASVRRLGVARATAVKRLNPFFSVLLAAMFLGEAIRAPDLAGMAAIAAGFALLLRQDRSRFAIDGAVPPAAYVSGVLAAFAYAVAYIARKLGLEAMPAPALGTLVSAVTGLVVHLGLATVSSRRRSDLRGMFAHLDRWIVAAAVALSIGQILLFAALAHAEVSVVVMIASLEIFLSLFLAVAVFGTERRIGGGMLVAAALATAGVILVAA